MNPSCVMLDTSFLIRLLDETGPVHENVTRFFRHFVEQGIPIKVSTIAIAEYTVIGNKEELPFRFIQIAPFNLQDAFRAGEMAAVVFQNKGQLTDVSRKVIPNDTKLFAQADVDRETTHFVTADIQSIKVYDVLKDNMPTMNFQLMNARTPFGEVFGLLDLK